VIEKLFAHPETIALMGQRSREIIEKEINIHTVLGNYMEAFRGATRSPLDSKAQSTKNKE
jgi:hypothetical protein